MFVIKARSTLVCVTYLFVAYWHINKFLCVTYYVTYCIYVTYFLCVTYVSYVT